MGKKKYDKTKNQPGIDKRGSSSPDFVVEHAVNNLEAWLNGSIKLNKKGKIDPDKMVFHDFFEAEREFVMNILNKHEHSVAHCRIARHIDFVNMREALIFLKKPEGQHYITFTQTKEYKNYLEAFRRAQEQIKHGDAVIDGNGATKVDVKNLRTVYPVTRLEQYSHDDVGDPTPEDFVSGLLSIKVVNYSITENTAYDRNYRGQEAVDYAMHYIWNELTKDRFTHSLEELATGVYRIAGLVAEAKREGVELRARKISGRRYQFTLQTPDNVKQIKLRRITFALATDLQNRVEPQKRRRQKSHASLWDDYKIEFGMELPEGKFINDLDAYMHYQYKFPVPDDYDFGNPMRFQRDRSWLMSHMLELKNDGIWNMTDTDTKEADQDNKSDQSEPPEQPSLF